jgi:hypothetical protein
MGRMMRMMRMMMRRQRDVELLVVTWCVSISCPGMELHVSNFAFVHAMSVSREEGCVEAQPVVQGREVKGRGKKTGNA